MPESVQTVKPKFEDVLKEIDHVQDHLHVSKDYHAFIYWFIATLTGKDEQTIKGAMCDGTHDKGIDAVVIDKLERTIIIFQSKFKRAGGKNQLSENDIKLLGTVRDYFKSRKALVGATSKANPATQKLLDTAFSRYTEGYTLELTFITTHKGNPAIEPLLRDTLAFGPNEFRVFAYDGILAVMADKSRDFLPVCPPYNLPFRSAHNTIVKTGHYTSWVLVVGANQLRDMATNYPIDNLFRKNVRNFLGDTNETNSRMLDTLRREANNFWYYNNGVTILCDSATLSVENKYIHLLNPQVINGCQTISTIREFKEDSEADLLVRVIASTDHEFIDAITLYQNSSNPVKKRDLKSNDPVQVRLHHELFKRGWYYEIKRGESFKTMASNDRNIKDQCVYEEINNSDAAKVLAALTINPGMAVSKGDEYFFGEAYEKIFPVDLSVPDCLAPALLRRLVKSSYAGEKYNRFEKAFVFKNPALLYVLKLLCDSLSDVEEWKKRFVDFWQKYDESTTEWTSFADKTGVIVEKAFKVFYDAWEDANEATQVDHRTFFQNSDTYGGIVTKSKSKIEVVQEAFRALVKSTLT